MIKESHNLPRRVYGVDFSGAKDAGKKIWIARGVIEEGVLKIEKCDRAEDFLVTKRKLEPCLKALREFIAGERDCAFGLDFPFGLPNEIVHKLFNVDNWKDFVQVFTKHYSHPETFKKECIEVTNGDEEKRVTDKKNATPFSPYNLWLYKQTYFGIHDILAPLVQDNLVCVLPMQSAVLGKPWILEICPASTLKQLEERLNMENLYTSYKGRNKKYRNQRLQILEVLKKKNLISLPEAIRLTALEDKGGDALDSIIAAYATFCACRNKFAKIDENENYALEGYVFA